MIAELERINRIHANTRLHGYPYTPMVSERANCGPTVLAAVMGLSTEGAIDLMDKVIEKGWNGYTNINHIRAALKVAGILMVKTSLYDEGMVMNPPTEPTLFFIQIKGAWTGKGWRSDYNHTHWALGDKRQFMDVNNPIYSGHPTWVDHPTWRHSIIPDLVQGMDGNGWHVRSAYLVEESK